MKTIKNTSIKISVLSAILLFAMQLMAQPPTLCDTCNYATEIIKHPKIIDSLFELVPGQDTGEFVGCDENSKGQKAIFFIHGLGGSIASWEKPKVWTADEYVAGVYGADYHASSYETSFFTVCQELNSDLADAPINQAFPNRCDLDDYAIAHSQGGIAARYLDWKWTVDPLNFGARKFRGLVTFATPHAGADIALTRTQHARFVQQVVTALYLDPFYDYRGISAKIDRLIDSTNAFIERSLVPIMIAGVHTNTLDEMRPGSVTMNNINAHNSALHKTVFYGIEQAPECWRVIDGVVNTPAEEQPLWQAEEDHEFLDTVNAKLYDHVATISDNKRKIKQNKWGIAVGALSIPFVPFLGSATVVTGIVVNNKLGKENDARQGAVDFLNNANTEWRYLIGSYHRDSLESVTRTVYKLTWTEKYGFLGAWYNQEREFNTYAAAYNFYNSINVYKKKDKNISSSLKTSIHQKFFPSDGVVLKRSQIAFPGVKHANIDIMKDNNHFQERNSGETERVMKNLYLGRYDSYFKNEKK